jgi:deoxyadenosine/deoxycytidine kinase
VVAGTIGAGKTTIAGGLAAKLNVPAFLEQPERNPFLERFYVQPARWAFTSQMWFLLDTCRQQRLIVNSRAGGVQDHSASEGVEVYSTVLGEAGTISPAELVLLRQAFAELRRDLPPPDVVVHLRARPEELLRRIRLRNRPYERRIGLDYLTALDLRRDNLFAEWTVCPVVEVNTERIDGRSPDGLRAIADDVLGRVSPTRHG